MNSGKIFSDSCRHPPESVRIYKFSAKQPIAVCALSGPIGWGALAVVAGTGAAASAVGGGITAAVTAKD